MSANSASKLLDASKRGDIKSVREILAKKGIDVNCKDILIHKYS